MEFGNVPPEELPGIDFTLPPDHPMTSKTIKDAGTTGNFKAYVGCTKWTHKPWIGNLYPVGTKDTDFAVEYARQFNTIEFGPTFYATSSADAIQTKWTTKVEGNPNFKFCPKMPQAITHIRRLKNAEQATTQFFDSLSGFGNHLGPILMQLGEAFAPKYFDALKSYLELFPKGFPVFLEVRHKDWFAKPEHQDRLFDLLQKCRVGAVITDSPGRRDCVHMQLPTPHAMIRFVGNNGQPIERQRLDAWGERMKSWKDNGLQSLWFFMHQHDELYAPVSCRYLLSKLNQELGLDVHLPDLAQP
jgi:uncharacterized protein YecE (DUF72 family)